MPDQPIYIPIDKKVADSLKTVLIIYRRNREKGTTYFQKSLARYS
jgi:hypothetical protein